MSKEDLENFQKDKTERIQWWGTRMALDFFKAAVGAGKQWSDALQLVRNSVPGHNLEHFQTCRIALFFFLL